MLGDPLNEENTGIVKIRMPKIAVNIRVTREMVLNV